MKAGGVTEARYASSELPRDAWLPYSPRAVQRAANDRFPPPCEGAGAIDEPGPKPPVVHTQCDLSNVAKQSFNDIERTIFATVAMTCFFDAAAICW